MTRPPRDMSRRREISVQLNMAVRREIRDLVRAEAEAQGVTITALVEAMVKVHCKGEGK
jgi:predicted HicB family RNase H-like nuclease